MNEAESRDPEAVCNVDDCNAWRQGDHSYCYHHKGLASGRADEDNTRAVKHAAYADHDKRYNQIFSDRERDLVDWVEQDYLDRYESVHGFAPPAGFKVRIWKIAVNVVTEMRVDNWYTDHPDELGTNVPGVNKEKKVSESGQVYYRYKKSPHMAAVKHLEQYNRQWLGKLGLLPSPDKKAAEAKEDLASLWAAELRD